MKLSWLILFSTFAESSAQQLPVHVSASVGYATFIDESDQSHATFGGSARFYFTRRNAIEPEVLYLYRDASDKDLLLQVNFVRDLGTAKGRAVPYLIGGAGYIWGLRSRFTERSPTRRPEASASAYSWAAASLFLPKSASAPSQSFACKSVLAGLRTGLSKILAAARLRSDQSGLGLGLDRQILSCPHLPAMAKMVPHSERRKAERTDQQRGWLRYGGNVRPENVEGRS